MHRSRAVLEARNERPVIDGTRAPNGLEQAGAQLPDVDRRRLTVELFLRQWGAVAGPTHTHTCTQRHTQRHHRSTRVSEISLGERKGEEKYGE